MQRRYTFLAAVALVALVLIPGAALAAGFSGGFGPKSSPLGSKNLSQGAPEWAGNASAGAGDGTCDGTCLGDQTRDQDRTQLRDGTCQTNQVCDGDQDRAQVRDRTRLNQTAPSENGKRFALQGRLQRGQGRLDPSTTFLSTGHGPVLTPMPDRRVCITPSCGASAIAIVANAPAASGVSQYRCDWPHAAALDEPLVDEPLHLPVDRRSGHAEALCQVLPRDSGLVPDVMEQRSEARVPVEVEHSAVESESASGRAGSTGPTRSVSPP